MATGTPESECGEMDIRGRIMEEIGRASAEAEEAPNPKIQAPENKKAPSSILTTDFTDGHG
jgi:hypothetical protein